MSARAILLRAADVVLTRGLCQGTMHTDDGRVCTEGAISIAAIELTGTVLGNGFRDAMQTVDAFVPEPRYVPPGQRVKTWNDKPGRTARQVANMLRRAAAAYEQEVAA